MDVQQAAIDRRKLGHVAVAHDFEVVIAKYLTVPRRCRPGFVEPSLSNEKGDLAARASGHHDQALVVTLQDLTVHPWTVVEAFEVGQCDEFDEVLITLVVARQDGHMEQAALAGIALVPAAGRDVHLAAYDGTYTLALRESVEVDRSIHSAVIGDRQAFHA